MKQELVKVLSASGESETCAIPVNAWQQTPNPIPHAIQRIL